VRDRGGTARHVLGFNTFWSSKDIALERLSFGVFLCAVAWAPFPLGSNRPWSWSLLVLLITGVWILWCCSIWRNPKTVGRLSRGLLGPIILGLLAIGWGIIQVVPFVPADWARPAWRIAAEVTGREVAPTISVLPWRSTTEIMKLSSYVMAAWLARVFAREPKQADILLNALVAIGAFYAAYGFVLVLIGQSQFEIFYGMPLQQVARDFPGPFVNHNSFATYEGLIAVCAGVRLVSGGWHQTEKVQGVRAHLTHLAQYLLGRGIAWLLATALAFSAVLSTGSRGGNLATWAAMIALVLIALGLATPQKRGWATLAIASSVMITALALLEMNGGSLSSRLNDMSSSGATDKTRLLLWNDAVHMIHNAPLTGWGLGTYQIVYPLFSTTPMPFIMDKAHNDYLELAAGWGLPAAVLWWVALLWLNGVCLRGLFVRRSNLLFPALGIGASILVGIHSLFDFSLQMPAVALTYATILGMGVGQAFAKSDRSRIGSQT